MDKSKKNTKKTYNATIIKALATKYDFTSRYIRQILSGERTPVFWEKVKKDYEASEAGISQILNNDDI